MMFGLLGALAVLRPRRARRRIATPQRMGVGGARRRRLERLGLLLMYRALRIGKVGVVAPIASTEGAIAAVFSVALGEQLTVGVAVCLGGRSWPGW